jgi:hypothetical protein
LSTRTARGRQAMLPLVRNSVIQYATNNSSSLWLSLIKIRTDGLSDHETNEIIAFWQWYITNDGLINYLALMIYLFINSIYDDLYVMCVEQTPIYFLNLSTWVISSLSTPKYLFIPIIHGIYVFFRKYTGKGGQPLRANEDRAIGLLNPVTTSPEERAAITKLWGRLPWRHHRYRDGTMGEASLLPSLWPPASEKHALATTRWREG